MAKPIPVFAFVFAAYAATYSAPVASPMSRIRKAGLNEDKTSGPGEEQASVVPVWRTLLHRGAEIWVKIGVVGHGRGRRLDLASADVPPRGDFDEVWLFGITETARGFDGIVNQSAHRQIKLGRKIHFERSNVQDWTLRLNAAKPAAIENVGPGQTALSETSPS